MTPDLTCHTWVLTVLPASTLWCRPMCTIPSLWMDVTPSPYYCPPSPSIGRYTWPLFHGFIQSVLQTSIAQGLAWSQHQLQDSIPAIFGVASPTPMNHLNRPLKRQADYQASTPFPLHARSFPHIYDLPYCLHISLFVWRPLLLQLRIY
jgi:hypothetical protein